MKSFIIFLIPFVLISCSSENTRTASEENIRNHCGDGMYLAHSGTELICSANPDSCPSGQTLTGFPGTQFCMKEDTMHQKAPSNTLECNQQNDEITTQMYEKYGNKNIVIREIFYSPIRQSCIYVSNAPITDGTEKSQLDDFLKNQTIITCHDANCVTAFEQKIKELK